MRGRGGDLQSMMTSWLLEMMVLRCEAEFMVSTFAIVGSVFCVESRERTMIFCLGKTVGGRSVL